MSQYFGSERGTVSPRTSLRKLHPTLSAHSGTQLPEGRLSRAILIKTRPHSAPKITSSHAGANASGGVTAHRHAICCTVKSASGTLILYLANKFKEGRMSCQDANTARGHVLPVQDFIYPEPSRICRTVTIRSAVNKWTAYRPNGTGHQLAFAHDCALAAGLPRRSLLCRLVLRIESNPAQATGKRVFERRHLYHDCGSD